MRSKEYVIFVEKQEAGQDDDTFEDALECMNNLVLIFRLL